MATRPPASENGTSGFMNLSAPQPGFDHYFGLLHNLDPVETVFFEDKGGAPDAQRQGGEGPAEVNELTKVCTDEALTSLSNKEEPFFLYLPHTMLHARSG